MKINHKEDYKRSRVNAYPSIGDQMDAMWKGGKSQEDMKKKIKDIKNKFPKDRG
jgi:hypothetical protein